MQAGAGVVMHAKPGDEVTEGRAADDACSATTRDRFARAEEALAERYDIDPDAQPHSARDHPRPDRLNGPLGGSDTPTRRV